MANLKLGLLGPLQITVDNSLIRAFESDKARALLAYLAVESNQPHRRDALLGLLWPDCPDEAARHNLRQTLYSLRQAIGDRNADPPYLLITRDEVQFNAASAYSLDVDDFNALLDNCDRHLPRCIEACPIHAERLEQALEIYRGAFLQEFFLADSAEFEEWATRQREALHRRALESVTYLANYSELSAHYDAAQRYALRQLELDPWREEAHRQVMRVYGASGQRSAALAQYETCRRMLAKELGVEPSAETRELYEQMKTGSWKPEVGNQNRPAISNNPSDRHGSNFPISSANLPTQLTPFIGRERELADLGQLIADPECRCITLVGPGGMGKTRLALQTAVRHGNKFAQGVAFVPLATIGSAEAVAPAIADALGFSFYGPTSPRAQLLNYLRDKQLLLVLDNVEQLVDAAEWFIEILQHAYAVKLLLTSREPLNVQGEWVFEVTGLDVPANEQAEQFEASSAVALFVQRARRTRTGFALDDQERAAVARLCRLVDGMPLALELAATWVKTLSVAEIVAEIERNLDFLSAPVRDLPERHRSIRAVFYQSWNMLPSDEQQVLNKLSVFRGFEREAAEKVAGASLSILASLVSKSLVRRVKGDRYDLHELVRQYAHERLIESGESDSACSEHLRFFLELAEAAEPELRSIEQLVWLDRLEEDGNNLSAALEWSFRCAELNHPKFLETREQAIQKSLGLVSALYLFWKRRAHWSEGRDWLVRALAQPAESALTRERVKALNAAVLLAAEQADTQAAWLFAEENIALARELKDSDSIAHSLNSLGFLLWKKKDFTGARAACAEALELFRKSSNRFAVADALHNQSHISINQGDYQAARSYCEEAATIYRELGDKLGLDDVWGDLGLVAYLQNDFTAARKYLEESQARFHEAASVPGLVSALNRLGDLARCQQDYQQAEKLYSECLALYRDMGDKDEFPSLLHNMGYVARHHGNYSEAIALFREGLAVHHEMHNHAGIAECLAGIAGVLTSQGTARQGARLFSAAETLREESGFALWPADQMEHDYTLALLHQLLDQETLAAAWAEGGGMEIEHAITEAMADATDSSKR